MKKRVSDQFWFPFWADKWIFGSMRIECTLEERAIWIDLLAFASKDEGYIRANEETPYLIQQLVGMLLIPEDKLKPAIKKFIKLRKLEEPIPGIYRIATWKKYQLSESYERVQRHRKKKSNGKMLQCNENGVTILNNNILENNKLNKSKLNKSKEENNKVLPPLSKKNINSKIEFDFDKRKFLNITIEDKSGWLAAYPACDIELELYKMREWLLANPEKRKKNYRRFIVNWLTRTQDKGGSEKIRRHPGGHPMTRKEEKDQKIDDWTKGKDEK